VPRFCRDLIGASGSHHVRADFTVANEIQ